MDLFLVSIIAALQTYWMLGPLILMIGLSFVAVAALTAGYRVLACALVIMTFVVFPWVIYSQVQDPAAEKIYEQPLEIPAGDTIFPS